jgi:hypothetical protein
VNVLGLFELTRTSDARRRAAGTAELRERVAAAVGRAEEAERALATVSARCGHAGGEPPPVARELITMADRLLDLRTSGTTEILEWLRTRVDALLALCEVAPITDGGTVDFLRHEVVADRPAPRQELVDHIADTVRPQLPLATRPDPPPAGHRLRRRREPLTVHRSCRLVEGVRRPPP